MADKVKISAKLRNILGKKVKSLRNEGIIPAVMYGKGSTPLALELNAHDFAILYKQSGGNTIIEIDLEKEDGKEKKNVLIHQVDRDAVSGEIIHADLLLIRMSEKITAGIPLKFVGDSAAVIELSGSLLTTKDEVEVECLPADLPHEIEVDISVLVDFESVIHVSDLKLPVGVEVKDEPEETVVHVEAPRTEEEMEELETPVAEEPLPESEEGQPEVGGAESEPEKE